MKNFSFKDYNKSNIITENFNDVIVEDISKVNILNEGIFFTKKDMYINFDKFENGSCNICFITGISGSGKSTLAKQLAGKYKAILIEPDMFYLDAKKNKDLETLRRKTNIVLYSYFKNNKKVYENIRDHEYIQPDMENKSNEFLTYVLSYAKKHKDKKFIVEGNMLYDSKHMSLSSYPFIILNTSALQSQLRSYKQHRKDIKQLWKYLPSLFRNTKFQDKLLQAYKQSLVNESFEILFEADDDLGPTDYNSDDLGGGDVDTTDDGGGDDDLGPTDYNEDDTSDSDNTDTTDDTDNTDDELDSLESDTDDPTSEPEGGDDGSGDVENSNDEQMNNDNDQDNENNKFLIKDYLELYNRLGEILEKISSNESFKFSRDVVYNKARMNIEKIKDMLFDYITLRFNKESYISNLYHFNMVIQAVNVNVAMIEKSPTVTEIQNNIKEHEKTSKKKG